jgi:adenylylsulfate kinase-like enzyme
VERVAYLSQILSRSGVITIVALISPFRTSRDYARKLVGDFVEVWVKSSLETCKKRDPKGLMRKSKWERSPILQESVKIMKFRLTRK